MSIINFQHKLLAVSNNKHISLDITMPKHSEDIPLVIFMHGFKGFKDWGAWQLVASEFAKQGFAFLKFNFSHNGTSPDQLLDFVDLEAFYNNNFLLEIADTKRVLTWVKDNYPQLDLENINIVAHSRAGGVALITANENDNVKMVSTWAAVSDYHKYISSWDIKKWEDDGKLNFYNGRTKQDMNIGYQFYTDLQKHYDYLDLEKVCSSLDKKVLIVHSEDDTSVSIDNALELASRIESSDTLIINSGGHTFGQTHPYEKSELPKELAVVVQKTIDFFNLN